MDVAQLGLAVDSSGVQKGTKDLDHLSNAAKRAQAAAGGVSSSTKNASAAAAGLAGSSSNAAAALNTEAAAATKAANAMRLHAMAANQNFAASNKFNTSNIAAQFQDIAVSAQMGMGALQIGLQQGTQLAAVIATMDRPLHGLSAAFMSVLSPVSLLVISITALVAAGLQMVNWGKAAAVVVTSLADVLDTIAPYAVAAAAALALIYAPAMVTGMVSIIALLARISVAALATAGSFTAAWLAALGPVGWLIAAIAAVGTAAYLLRDEIKAAIGVDVVGIMKTAGNFIINSFEAAFSDVKFIWAKLPDILGAAVHGAANLVIKGMNLMIQKAAEGIDWLISKANSMTSTLGMDPIAPIGKVNPIKDLGNPFADKLGSDNAAHAAEIDRIMGQDRLGQFGAAIGEGASAASGKLKELAGWMTTVDEKGKKKKGGGKTEAEKYSDIVDGANRRIATLKAEQAALGLTGEAAAKLAYETDLLNEAQRKGIELTAAQRGELSTLAGSMASIEAATVKAQDALDFAQDASRGFFTDFADGLRNGEGLWKSFADAAVNALDKIASKLLDSGLDMLFGGGSTGGYGILSSIFGIGGGGGGSDPWAGLRGYADGTASARAGVAMVGERGPELVRFRGGEQVVPNHMLGRASNNNQPPAMNFNFAPVVQMQGGGAGAGEDVTKALKKYEREFTTNVVKSLREIKTRGLA